MAYSRPGVYINERLLSDTQLVTGTANAAGAAIGAFAQGPSSVTLVTSWYDFVKKFGGYNAAFPATFGVGQFFQNGGSELYVKRVLSSGAAVSTATIKDSASTPATVVTVTSKNKGADTTNLRAQLIPVRSATATITGASITTTTITYTAVNTFTVGDAVIITGCTGGTNSVAFNVTGVVATTNGTTFTVTVPTTFTATYGSGGTAYATGNYYNFVVTKEAGTADTVVSSVVTAGASDDIVLEQYNNVVINSSTSADFLETVVNLVSDNVSVTVNLTTGVPTASIYPFTGGTDSTAPVYSDYVTAASTGFTTVTRPLVMFAPELYAKLVLDADGTPTVSLTAVQNAMTAYATTSNSFAVLDAPAPTTAQTAAQALAYATGLTKTAYGAVYYPNFYIQDPVGRSTRSLRKVSPSGAVAGLYIATDKAAGPFKVAAGTDTPIKGAISLEVALSSADLDTLNTSPSPVNAIRNIPGAGIVAMGGRTLLQDNTANRFVNMRRSLNYLRRNLEDVTQFAMFENNDETLWARLRTVVAASLNVYRNQGGLRGSASTAFYVKCDSETTTAADVINGQVNMEVGVALQYPAEFVVINLSQLTVN